MKTNQILVVDDELNIREVFKDAFVQGGYSVVTAGSAEDALELIKETPFFVFFLDLKLPGMNGVDLCRQIRKDWPMAIVHAVTGYTSLFELHDCREAGFEDYFRKPVNLSELLSAADQAFRKLERWMAR